MNFFIFSKILVSSQTERVCIREDHAPKKERGMCKHLKIANLKLEHQQTLNFFPV